MRTTFLRVLVICVASIAASHLALLAQVGPVIGGTEGWVSCDSVSLIRWGGLPKNLFIPDTERVTSMYYSSSFFALTKSGSVYGLYIGERFLGDPADSNNRNNFTPRRIPFDKPVKMVGGEASQFSMYLTYDGDVYATTSGADYLECLFGKDQTSPVYRPRKIALPKKVRAISGSSGGALALMEDGTVWSWGWNVGGILGRGTDSDLVSIGQIEGLTGIRNIRSCESAGELGPCYAIDSFGMLYTWGTNSGGQIGDGTRNDRNSPYRVSITDVVDAKGGRFHTIALKSDGSVWTWGNNSYGQLGIPSLLASFTPQRVTGLPPIREIHSSQMSCFAIDSTGRWWTWGQNLSYLMLGIPRADAVRSPTLMRDPCSTSDVAGDSQSRSIGINPQPAAQYVNIRHGLSAVAVAIEIVDVLGRPVITQTTTLDSVPVDVSSLPPGTYAARCSGDGHVVTSVLHVAR